MIINWSLDRREPLDAADILGNIEIVDDHKSSIICEDTFVDSWFSVLMEGLQSLKNQESKEIEIPEESHLLVFQFEQQKSAIEYSNSSITIYDFESAIENLKIEIRSLVSEYDNLFDPNGLSYLAEFNKKYC